MRLQEKVKMLREQFPKGTVVELIHMEDIQAPPDGTRGIVQYVDDIGNVHVRWETGSGLSLVPEEDKYRIIKRGGMS